MEQKLFDAAAKLPETHAQLDTSQLKTALGYTNSVRRVVLTLAACAAAICIILFGAIGLAAEVNEYQTAIAYFSENGLPTDGLSRKEIKTVYTDIITGSFTHPKTAGVLAGVQSTTLQKMDPRLREMYDRYFDWEKMHAPEDYEISMITSGMHITEVIEILGKPHNFGQTPDGVSLEWETSLCWRFVFYVTPEEGAENLSIFERYTKHSVIDRKPVLFDPIPVLTRWNRENYGQYFDPSRTHRPAEADILSITPNMHSTEVVKLIGKPHGVYGGQMGGLLFLWQSTEGRVYGVEFLSAEDAPENLHSTILFMEHGIVASPVTAWPPSWYIQYMDPNDPAYPKDHADLLAPTGPDDPLTPTDPTKPCAHVWGQWIVVAEATCDRAGQQERSCSNCNEKQTQEIPKREHEESDWIIDKPAGVGVEGHKHTECIRCHRQMREETIPAITQDHQHSATTWVISTYPGCTTSGTMQRVCSCGEVLETKSIAPVGHDHVLTAEKKATCTENGSLTYTCTRCSNSYTTKINATGHVFGDWQTIREPSNGQDGEARRTCKNCSFYETKTLMDESKVAGGTWGTMTWAVFTDGRLVVTGSGAMPDGNTEGHEAWKFVLPDWCEYNQQITTVLLDDRITVIGDSNFYSLFKVTSVHLPASLQEIRNKAFSSCGLGEGITFPDTLTTIGNRAFEYYKGTALTLPASCTSIGEQAFAFAPNLKTADLPGVTSFGQYAFAQCKALERVNLCPKLQQIPTGLFKDCWMLNELSIPDSVQSIGDSAFLNCFSLRRLTFGTNSKLASIGENALPYGLTTFTIPKNVTSIGTGNFTHAWEVLNLSSATVPFSPTSEHAQLITSAASSRVIEENGFVFFTTADGEGVLIGCNVDAAQITIPSHYTYQSRKVTVIGIADYAIRGCLRTEKVVLPSTLQFVADYGLFFCPKLENCVWLSSQKSLDQLDFDWNKWTWSSTNAPQKQVINVLNTDGREFYYIKAQGTCGTEAIYKLYGKRSDLNSSVLSIEGSGAVTDTLHREFNSTANVKYVVINPGITELGNSCLTNFLSAEFVYTGTQEQWEQVKKGYNWGIGQEPLQFIPDFFL